MTDDSLPHPAGAVTGAPLALLRLEGLVLLAGAAIGYDLLNGGWATFALLFLLPDLAMLGYLAGPRIGAIAYNTTHTTLSAAALALAGWLFAAPSLYPLALIWLAHVGFDRMLGYGLKYASAFGDTHLGRAFGRLRQVAA